MTGVERETEQEAFMNADERRTVMVATSAFGLGIDKADIRFVMHFQSPASLEQYVQEAGRGGRDGRKANCILLYDGSDRAIHEGLLARSRVRPDQLYKLGAALAAWAQEGREPNVQALAVSAELGPRIASALLTKLEEAGLVRFDGDQIQIPGSAETLEQDARALAGQFETLRRQDARRLDALGDYAASDECRAIYLRRYFGEPDETPCELCDVCRGSPERPAAFFEPLVRPAQPKRRRGSRRGGRPQRDGHRDPDRGGRPPAPHRQPHPALQAAQPAADGMAASGEEGRKRRRRGRRGGRRRRGRREGNESGAPPEQPEG
jgi:ATP-dependent DNA helicase RecQ